MSSVSPELQCFSDAELLRDSYRGAGRSAETPFRVVYERHVSAVFRYLRTGASPEDAEELTSDAFVVAWKRRSSFDDAAASARPWLLGIAHKLLQEYWRKARRRESSDRHPDDPVRPGEDPAVSDIDVLRHALSNEPDRTVRLVFLVAIADLTIVDAAAVLGMTPGAARVALHRIRSAELATKIKETQA